MLVRLIYWLVRLALLPLWAPFWMMRRRVRQGAYLYVEMDGAVTELAAVRWFDAWSPRPISVQTLAEIAAEAARDSRVKGLLIILKGFHAGMATAASMRDALAPLRAAGKEVVVHLPVGGGNKEIYVACAANRIFVGPQALLAPVGFVSSTRYLKGALDKIGANADVMARGAYKSAGETLTRDSMSDPQREQVGALLDEMYGTLVRAIADSRGKDEAQARAIVDGAPYLSSAAVEAGLVDGAAYEDELPTVIGSREHPACLVEAMRYLAGRHARLLPRLRRRPVIGIIQVHGAIVGGTRLPLGGGRIASDERIIATVRAARMLRQVRGVVLHIDSPGGSALASDRMHHEIVQLAREKPVVACMANVAASGGYYIAAAAHEIIAQPVTVTGSIGVVAARLVLEPLLQRLGITTETIQRGAHAGLLEAGKPLGEQERAALDREIGGIYDAFVGVVARGRNKSTAAVEEVAQGRVWTGRDAKERGLVDLLGGLTLAVASVTKRIGAVPGSLDVAPLRAPMSRMPPLALPTAASPASVLGQTFLKLLGSDDIGLVLASGPERVLAWSPLASSFWE